MQLQWQQEDVDDLYKLQEEWTSFVNENEDVAYASWLITPMYRSASDFTNDIGWLGVSPSWSAFGKAYDAWFDRAGDIAENLIKFIHVILSNHLLLK